MPECIHGLEIPVCDSCFPQAVPQRPVLARSSSRSRVSAPTPVSRKSYNSGAQRIYHVTHINNLEPILARGALIAEAVPVVDLSTELTRELRRSAQVTAEGSMVSEYVAFSLSPHATFWERLRTGAHDETRWSSAARSAASVDFVFLVSTVGILGSDAVIADGDAAHSLTRFARGESATRMLEQLYSSDQLQEAEVLCPTSVPFGSVQLIGVANNLVRDRVKKLTTTKVVVYPPWFQITE
ncbi:MAG: DarT ssDNA thymidine ADP-ribosyltransferase family protein [Rhodoglobus sp.]